MADPNDIIDDNRDRMACPSCNAVVFADTIRECLYCDDQYCPECGDAGDEICNECMTARDESVDWRGWGWDYDV